MSDVILYRQYWMATLRDRRCCQVCGTLAINALEYVGKSGICTKVVWLCGEVNQTEMVELKVG